MADEELHPLVSDALRLLVSDSSAGYRFPDNFLASHAVKMQAIADGAELFGLIGNLLSFAGFLRQQQSSPEAAGSLVTLAESLAPRLEELAHQDARQHATKSDDRLAALKQQIAREKQLNQTTAPELAKPTAGGVSLRGRGR